MKAARPITANAPMPIRIQVLNGSWLVCVSVFVVSDCEEVAVDGSSVVSPVVALSWVVITSEVKLPVLEVVNVGLPVSDGVTPDVTVDSVETDVVNEPVDVVDEPVETVGVPDDVVEEPVDVVVVTPEVGGVEVVVVCTGGGLVVSVVVVPVGGGEVDVVVVVVLEVVVVDVEMVRLRFKFSTIPMLFVV
jgi:hypothetical protein